MSQCGGSLATVTFALNSATGKRREEALRTMMWISVSWADQNPMGIAGGEENKYSVTPVDVASEAQSVVRQRWSIKESEFEDRLRCWIKYVARGR